MNDVVDQARLEMLTDGDREIIDGLLELFNDTVARCTDTLAACRDNDTDPEAWATAIHELKGASDNLGFKQLAALCREAERNVAPSAEQMADIYKHIQEAVAAIHLHFNSN